MNLISDPFHDVVEGTGPSPIQAEGEHVVRFLRHYPDDAHVSDQRVELCRRLARHLEVRMALSAWFRGDWWVLWDFDPVLLSDALVDCEEDCCAFEHGFAFCLLRGVFGPFQLFDLLFQVGDEFGQVFGHETLFMGADCQVAKRRLQR